MAFIPLLIHDQQMLLSLLLKPELIQQTKEKGKGKALHAQIELFANKWLTPTAESWVWPFIFIKISVCHSESSHNYISYIIDIVSHTTEY